MTAETPHANQQSADQLICTARIKPTNGPHGISVLYFGGTEKPPGGCPTNRRHKTIAQTASIDIVDASEQHHDTTILNPKLTKKFVHENCPPAKRCFVRRVLVFLTDRSKRFSKEIRASLGSLRTKDEFRSSRV